MGRWPSSRTWVLGVAVLFFVVCCVLPVTSLFLEILRRPDPITSELLLDARRRGLLSPEKGAQLGFVAQGLPWSQV